MVRRFDGEDVRWRWLSMVRIFDGGEDVSLRGVFDGKDALW